MNTTENSSSAGSERLYYLDWLKVFAMLMVFVFHNAHFFDFIDWEIKNKTESPVMMLIFLLIHFWSMPLFFFLAGAGTKFALERKTDKEYVAERIKRLIIPLGIGMLILAPPQGYVESLNRFNFHGSFIDYYPHFFENLSYVLSFKAFEHNTYHLWFLGFLFLFSIISLPLFKALKNGFARDFISQIASFCDKKGVIFLFAIPILISHLVLRVSFPEYIGWANFLYWLIYFIYGYIIFSHQKFKEAILRHGISALIIGLCCMGIIVIMLLLNCNVTNIEHPDYSLQSIAFMILYSILTWSWVIFMLSLSSKLLNFSNSFLKYCSEAVLPFYLLHQTVILVVGFYIIQMNMGIFPKFFIISTISLALTVGIYDFLVRRIRILRFLFGMKLLKT